QIPIAWAEARIRPWVGAMEATLSAGWIYDVLKPIAQELKVADPAMLKAIVAVAGNRFWTRCYSTSSTNSAYDCCHNRGLILHASRSEELFIVSCPWCRSRCPVCDLLLIPRSFSLAPMHMRVMRKIVGNSGEGRSSRALEVKISEIFS